MTHIVFLISVLCPLNTVLCIISGSPCSSSRSFNYVVLIGYKANLNYCTGCLISESWIISSASCLAQSRNERIEPRNVYIQAGTLVDYISVNFNLPNLKVKRHNINFSDFIDSEEYEKISLEFNKKYFQPNSKTTHQVKTLFEYVTPPIKSDSFFLVDYNKTPQMENATKKNIDKSVDHQTNNVLDLDQYVRQALNVILCPYFDLQSDLSEKCDLVLIQVTKPFKRSDSINWITIGNGPISQDPFQTYLSGWGRIKQNITQKLVKNFIMNIDILPPQHCPPSKEESQGIFCLMTSDKGHPCSGDEGLPLAVNFGEKRRLIGVGHGSEPLVVYRRRRNVDDSGLFSCGHTDREELAMALFNPLVQVPIEQPVVVEQVPQHRLNRVNPGGQKIRRRYWVLLKLTKHTGTKSS